MTIGATAHPMIAIAVPTRDALLGAIEDNWRLQLAHQGRKLVDITWRSGFKARDALKQCYQRR